MVIVEHNPVALNIKDRFLGRGESFKGTTPRWVPRLLGLTPIYNKVPVRSLIQDAANLASAYHPFSEVDVTLMHSSLKEDAFDMACDGFSTSAGIGIIFYSTHPRFRRQAELYKAVTEVLPAFVAHELGHLARIRSGQNADNLYGRVVHEAAAMYLQTTIYPDIVVPPVDSTGEQVQLLEQHLREQGKTIFTKASAHE